MVKQHRTVKLLQSLGRGRDRTLLDRDPNTEIIAVRHEQNPAPGYHLGIWIDFDHGGVRHALLMAIKANGAPRFACSKVYRLESCIAHLHRSEGRDVTRQSASCSMPPHQAAAGTRYLCFHRLGDARHPVGERYRDQHPRLARQHPGEPGFGR